MQNRPSLKHFARRQQINTNQHTTHTNLNPTMPKKQTEKQPNPAGLQNTCFRKCSRARWRELQLWRALVHAMASENFQQWFHPEKFWG